MKPRSNCRSALAQRFGATWLAAGALLAIGNPAAAQDVTEPSLKAAFVYNLAKFTEWPADLLPPASPLVTCVVGDASVAAALERIAKGRMLLGRTVTVVSLALDASPKNCHVLYTSGLTAAQVAPLINGVRGLPVLTVVDIDAAIRPPGIAHMYVENGKLRFDLDHGLARRSRIQLSSKLLPLAKRVFDDRTGGSQ